MHHPARTLIHILTNFSSFYGFIVVIKLVFLSLVSSLLDIHSILNHGLVTISIKEKIKWVLVGTDKYWQASIY